MGSTTGKQRTGRRVHFLFVPLSFFLAEVFAFFFLSLNTEEFRPAQLWPLAFGALWAAILSGFVRLLPAKAGRVAYGILYFAAAIYAAVETGYFYLFSELMWLSDFRYASEGSDSFSVLLSYPIGWWLGLAALAVQGVVILVKFPGWRQKWSTGIAAAAVAVAASVGAACLPQAVFLQDGDIRYASSDYGRVQSAEAAYNNMFNAHRLYQVCGLYQTLEKDIYKNGIYPLTPSYAAAQKAGKGRDQRLFCGSNRGRRQRNDRPSGRKKRGSGADGVHGRLDDREIYPNASAAHVRGHFLHPFLHAGVWRHPYLQYGILREYRLVPEQSGRLRLRLHHQHLPPVSCQFADPGGVFRQDLPL